jgi:transglutaminase-like putative cysteine protease
MTIRVLVRLLAFAAVALSLASARDDDQRPGTGELWYRVDLAGKRAGYMHSSETVADGKLVTRSDLMLSIRRAETDVVRVRVEYEFEETSDGKPLRAVSTQTLGASPTTISVRFLPDKIEQSTASGTGKPTVVEVPLPEGAWLTPGASVEYIRKRLEAGAKEFTVRTMEPSMGMAMIVTTHKVLEQTTFDTGERTIPVFRVASTVDRMPGITTESLIDVTGQPVKLSMSFGGIPMTMTVTDRANATLAPDAPELMKSTLVKPDRPIARARETRRAVYALSVADGELEWADTGGVQSLERRSPREVVVTVDLARSAPVKLDDAERAKALASSTLVTSADEGVKALAARADKGKPATAAARAEAMRRIVHEHIRSKNLGVGFGSAADTARSREGDCSEHAVLLAAMLRAGGIPARVVSGLVYVDSFAGVDGVFGYHMWAQALLPDETGVERWVDLDATLGASTPFDATHIAVVASVLDDADSFDSMVAVSSLLGRLRISVKETR